MAEPIRVLHVFGRLDAGGAESRTMDIYRSIDREKIQFDFAIHTSDRCFFSKEIESLGGKIYNFPRFTGNNYFSYKKSWDDFFMRYPEYKIVHGHQTSTGFIYLKSAKKHGVPVRIAHARNSNKDSIIKKYCTKLSRFYTTHKFAVSKLAGISEFGEKAINDDVKVIPNAIDTYKYIYNEKIRKSKRKDLELNNNFSIVHIGRFHPQKNHEFLLEIFKLIHEKNKNSKLILVGDGLLRKQIEQKITQLGLEDSVILLGICSDVPDILQAVDILLFPSFFEGLPGVVLEAQAAGLPCIISDRITDEVKVTDLVEYVSLDKSEEYWAEEVLKFSQGFKRRDTYNEIAKAGYDIKSVVKWYQDFYLQCYKEIIYENN